MTYPEPSPHPVPVDGRPDAPFDGHPDQRLVRKPGGRENTGRETDRRGPGGDAGRWLRAKTYTTPAAAAAVLVVVALLGMGIVSRDTGELHIPGAGTTTLLRSVFLAALFLHLGEIVGHRLARTVPGTPRVRPPGWGVALSLAGAAAAFGQIVQMADLNRLSFTETYATDPGGMLLLQANAFLAAAACAWLKRPAWAVLPLAAVILAEAVRAHPELDTPEVGIVLTTIHLTASALWTGGLVYALRALHLWRGRQDGEPGAGRVLLGRYARMAVFLYVALAVTGTFSTLRRLPLEDVFTTAYGRTLVVKLVLVAVVSVLALVARSRLHRKRGGRRGRRARIAEDAVERPARAEMVMLVGVVAVSALLTVVPTPTW
ncbi:CopD family protein [Streptomyces candidus]|uniref:Putative copper export protein n=1 Tax=Streptomyces candidus TaxID=67283 RepID=A0A7X0HHT5_9ACTN|nr:CopD family protein [Streptomyces candidus]MBB6437927.1 putative copper export protein [Streptomyces candidus]GHH49703.1 membrane protein [Streptomyces candidus]